MNVRCKRTLTLLVLPTLFLEQPGSRYLLRYLLRETLAIRNNVGLLVTILSPFLYAFQIDSSSTCKAWSTYFLFRMAFFGFIASIL